MVKVRVQKIEGREKRKEKRKKGNTKSRGVENGKSIGQDWDG